MYHWIVELYTRDRDLSLTKDLSGLTSKSHSYDPLLLARILVFFTLFAFWLHFPSFWGPLVAVGVSQSAFSTDTD